MVQDFLHPPNLYTTSIGVWRKRRHCSALRVVQGLVGDYDRTPPKVHPPKIRTLLGLIKPYIVTISSLNPGGGAGGGIP